MHCKGPGRGLRLCFLQPISKPPPAQPPRRMSMETRLLQASLPQQPDGTLPRSLSELSPAHMVCSSGWPHSYRKNGYLSSASGWERHIPQGVISPTVEKPSEGDGKSQVRQMSTPEQMWTSACQRHWAVVIYAGSDCASEDRPQGCSPQTGLGGRLQPVEMGDA